MVDFKKMLERNREIDRNVQVLKQVHFENKDANVNDLDKVMDKITDLEIAKGVIRELADKLWEKNFTGK